MATLHNQITIDAPIDRIWDILSTVDELDKYDPTVKKSRVTSTSKKGPGSSRRVDMLDGKNWFEEKTTVFKPNESLAFELTSCSFPMKSLKHTYSFEKSGAQVTVSQVMEYEVKFGLLGKLLDAMMISKQSDAGIKKFMAGLKSYAEKK